MGAGNPKNGNPFAIANDAEDVTRNTAAFKAGSK